MVKKDCIFFFIVRTPRPPFKNFEKVRKSPSLFTYSLKVSTDLGQEMVPTPTFPPLSPSPILSGIQFKFYVGFIKREKKKWSFSSPGYYIR